MTRWLRAGALVACLIGPSSAAAQNVSEVQVAPAQLTLKVGQRSVISATLFDNAGNILNRRIRWTSANLEVVRIEYDTLKSDVATLVGVGNGFALVEARVGSTTGSAAVQVEAAVVEALPPPVTPPVITPVIPTPAPAAALPDTVMSPGAADAVLKSLVRLDVFRFGVPATCGNGVIGGDGLILTTYGTIVGADSVIVQTTSGLKVSGARIASYDVDADIAALKLTAPTPDSLVPGAEAVGGQVAWVVGAPECGPARAQRTRVASRDIGALQLDDNMRGLAGAALVNQRGELLGLVRQGTRTGLGSQAQDHMRVGRNAALTGALLGIDQVARRENQTYGTLNLRADITGAAVRLVPLEKWQLSTAGQTGSLPFAFNGPMGRYRADLLVNGSVSATSTVNVLPGQVGQVTLVPPPILTPAPVLTPAAPVRPPAQSPRPAPPPESSSVHSGGGFPWGVVLLVGVGGGAAAFFLTKKSGGTPVNGGTGSITIHLPLQ